MKKILLTVIFIASASVASAEKIQTHQLEFSSTEECQKSAAKSIQGLADEGWTCAASPVRGVCLQLKGPDLYMFDVTCEGALYIAKTESP